MPGAETAGVGGPAPRAAAPERKTSVEPAGPSASGASAERPAILSEEAERRVAASFGELSEAFAGRSRKTFDELAAEMLGPMLRDWLDENLPGLVERLVREEIQRVARRA